MTTSDTSKMSDQEIARLITRKMPPLIKAGVEALRDSGWRPGMTEQELVIPIVVDVLAEAGMRLQDRLAARCGSCDHLPRWHQSGGCSYRVGEVAPGVEARCPCVVPGDGGQVTSGGGAL